MVKYVILMVRFLKQEFRTIDRTHSLPARALGYEPNRKKLSPIDFNAFGSCQGGQNQSNSPSFGPLLDPIFSGLNPFRIKLRSQPVIPAPAFQ